MGILRLNNSFSIRVQVGDSDLPLSLSALRECTIVQDMYNLLPSFRFRVTDSEGTLTHLVPFDQSSHKFYMEIKREGLDKGLNSFNFLAFRKRPISERNEAAIFDVSGLLDLEQAFMYETKSYNGAIQTTIESIGSDLGVDEVDISPTLSYSKLLVNPGWNRLQFLNYLKKTISGKSGQGGYQCFIKRKEEKTVLVFRTLEELINTGIVQNLVIGEAPYEDCVPVHDYEIFDNYKVLTFFGGKVQDYSYFDYFNNSYAQKSLGIDNYLSLTEYFLLDRDDIEYNDYISRLGRNNEYNRTYEGKAKSSYYNRLTNLSKMWAFTWGLPNISPGDTVELVFGKGLGQGNMLAYQYSGYWLVEKVVHTVGDAFLTKLLLTRNGMDTSIDTTLYPATRRKTA